MHEKRFRGSPDFLRSPQRVAMMEVDRVVRLTLEGLTAQTALDVGTGSGLFAEVLRAQIPSVVAADVSNGMLQRARELTPSVVYVQAEMEWLPFAGETFDIVFLGHVLHETHDLAHTMKELKRCARRRIVALEWPYRDEPMGPPLHHRLRPEQVVATAQDLEIEHVEVVSLSHMVLYRLNLSS